jgi:Ca2+-binding RTX toxin-like protein
VIRGGNNDDEIYGGRGQDDIFGNDGDDYINSADKDQPDTVDCGGGLNDRAVVDDEDNVILGTCEDIDIAT